MNQTYLLMINQFLHFKYEAIDYCFHIINGVSLLNPWLKTPHSEKRVLKQCPWYRSQTWFLWEKLSLGYFFYKWYPFSKGYSVGYPLGVLFWYLFSECSDVLKLCPGREEFCFCFLYSLTSFQIRPRTRFSLQIYNYLLVDVPLILSDPFPCTWNAATLFYPWDFIDAYLRSWQMGQKIFPAPIHIILCQCTAWMHSHAKCIEGNEVKQYIFTCLPEYHFDYCDSHNFRWQSWITLNCWNAKSKKFTQYRKKMYILVRPNSQNQGGWLNQN